MQLQRTLSRRLSETKHSVTHLELSVENNKNMPSLIVIQSGESPQTDDFDSKSTITTTSTSATVRRDNLTNIGIAQPLIEINVFTTTPSTSATVCRDSRTSICIAQPLIDIIVDTCLYILGKELQL